MARQGRQQVVISPLFLSIPEVCESLRLSRVNYGCQVGEIPV